MKKHIARLIEMLQLLSLGTAAGRCYQGQRS